VKISMSRQHIYLLGVSIVLLVFVIAFSFLVLIPQGKDYREKRGELKLESKELNKYQDFYEETEITLKELQQKHRRVIVAFEAKFNPDRFKKQYNTYFSSLEISEIKKMDDNDGFATYEVNTTSQISSPKSFYNFLDAINKGDWIISVNFPINFVRDAELIKSSFTMQILSSVKDSNATKKEAQ
jgi:hypothetical protein